jgi:hypothetical protein
MRPPVVGCHIIGLIGTRAEETQSGVLFGYDPWVLTRRDNADIVAQMVGWMIGELVGNGVDGSQVVVRGYYDIDAASVVLVVRQRSGKRSSSRRTVPDQAIARATVSDEFAHGGRPSEGPEAVAFIMRVIRSQASHLLLPEVEAPPEEPVPEPTQEDLDLVREILEQSRARRDRRPARPRGGGPGRPGRTTDTP